EAHLAAFVRRQDDVGEIAVPDDVARRDGVVAAGWPREDAHRDGSQRGQGQAGPSRDVFHDLWLLPDSGYGVPLVSPIGAMSNRSIIAWSSWIVLWQCIGYFPWQSRKRKKSVALASASNRSTSLRPVWTNGDVAGGRALIERVWNSSKWMWIGCSHSPPSLISVHCSTEFSWTVKRMSLQAKNRSLICQPPPLSEKTNVRLTLGVTAVLGRS